MGQKVITGFWWNLDYHLHPETILPLFADLSPTMHRMLRLCSAIVHFILNNCFDFVCYG